MTSRKLPRLFQQPLSKTCRWPEFIARAIKARLRTLPQSMIMRFWANAMDELFPMLKCTEEDGPEKYDKENPDIPWYQRPAEFFGDAQKVVEAIENFKIGFQARGLHIRQDLGPGASDAAVAAAVRGATEATLQIMSCPGPQTREGTAAKPPPLARKCYPIR